MRSLQKLEAAHQLWCAAETFIGFRQLELGDRWPHVVRKDIGRDRDDVKASWAWILGTVNKMRYLFEGSCGSASVLDIPTVLFKDVYYLRLDNFGALPFRVK